MWELDQKEGWALKNWCFWSVVLKKTLKSPLDNKEVTSQSSRKSTLNMHCKDWCWSLSSNPLATWCKELTHLKRLWCWEGLGAGEGDDRGWDGWMASLTRWTWVWVDSRSWWWTGRPGMLQFMGLQRVGHDWAAELNWTELDPSIELHYLSSLGTNESLGDLAQILSGGWKCSGLRCSQRCQVLKPFIISMMNADNRFILSDYTLNLINKKIKIVTINLHWLRMPQGWLVRKALKVL